MKIYNNEHRFSTNEQFQVTDLSDWLIKEISNSDIQEGLALVYSGHTTGALILNENEKGLTEDLKQVLRHHIPDITYNHPINAKSHLVSILLSSNQVIPLKNGKPNLGRWQSLLWLEAEKRPRIRTVKITILGQ